MKMTNGKQIVVLFFPAMVLIGWVILLTVQFVTQPEVKVCIAGYDPRDLLSGHYIAYTIDWDKTDCRQFYGEVCPKKEFEDYADNEYWGKRFRYYIPEKYADKLDKEFKLGQHRFEVVYKYSRGFAPMAVNLLVDGVSWREQLEK